jgi:hypothetical protein
MANFTIGPSGLSQKADIQRPRPIARMTAV